MAKKKKKTRKSQAAKSAAAPKVEPRAVEKADKKKAGNKPVAAKRSSVPARKQPNALQRLIRETRGELKKVTWPTREEAIQLTKVVLIVTFAMSAFLGVMDWLFNKFFAFLFGLF